MQVASLIPPAQPSNTHSRFRVSAPEVYTPRDPNLDENLPTVPRTLAHGAISPPQTMPNQDPKATWAKDYVRAANKNPTNLKYGGLTKKWVESGTATLDPIEAGDGGRYLRFSTVTDGLNAAKDLLLSPGYRDLPVDRALHKWSANAYQAVHLRLGELGSKAVAELSPEELTKLITEMAHYESGYRAVPTAASMGSGLGSR